VQNPGRSFCTGRRTGGATELLIPSDRRRRSRPVQCAHPPEQAAAASGHSLPKWSYASSSLLPVSQDGGDDADRFSFRQPTVLVDGRQQDRFRRKTQVPNSRDSGIVFPSGGSTTPVSVKCIWTPKQRCCRLPREPRWNGSGHGGFSSTLTKPPRKPRNWPAVPITASVMCCSWPIFISANTGGSGLRHCNAGTAAGTGSST